MEKILYIFPIIARRGTERPKLVCIGIKSDVGFDFISSETASEKSMLEWLKEKVAPADRLVLFGPRRDIPDLLGFGLMNGLDLTPISKKKIFGVLDALLDINVSLDVLGGSVSLDVLGGTKHILINLLRSQGYPRCEKIPKEAQEVWFLKGDALKNVVKELTDALDFLYNSPKLKPYFEAARQSKSPNKSPYTV